VFDYSTGARLETLSGIHELTITSLSFYSTLQYLITTSRDSRVKVWNRQNYLIMELREPEQSNAPVTASLVPKTVRGEKQPFLITSASDGIIRLWNLETSHCIYRLQTTKDILGMGWIKNDNFYHYTKTSIYIWNLNRYYCSFSYFGNPAIHISRIEAKDHASRILAVADDGSMKILSPITGAVLMTGFPILGEDSFKSIAYDIPQGNCLISSFTS
jgi:WD40 repeat protein